MTNLNREGRAVIERSLGVDQLEFESLEGFPCGCVAVVQRARPWPVTVASIEVQGPHCLLDQHRPGCVVRLESSWDEDDEFLEEAETGQNGWR